MLAYNLGNLWRRLALPSRIDNWSLTSLQQRLVKTGGRLVKHARYYWLLLAESHLTRRLFGWQHSAANLGATAACGITKTARQEEEFINHEAREGEVSEKSLRAAAVPGGKGQ